MQIIWTPEMVSTALRMRDAGIAPAQVADRIGVATATLNRARRLGVIDWPIKVRGAGAPRTHCKAGHDLSVTGWMHSNGTGRVYRMCKTCRNVRVANRKAGKR